MSAVVDGQSSEPRITVAGRAGPSRELSVLVGGRSPRRSSPWAERAVPEPRAQGAKRWTTSYLRRLVVADVLAASLAALLATTLGPLVEMSHVYWRISVLVVVVWPVLVLLARGYDKRSIGVTVNEYRTVLPATLGLLALAGVSAVMLNVALSRAYLLILLPSLCFLALVARRSCRLWLMSRRRHGALMQRTLVVGTGAAVASLAATLKATPNQGLEPVAVCVSDANDLAHDDVSTGGLTRFDFRSSIEQAVESSSAEAVVVASDPHLSGTRLRRLAWMLEDRNIELFVSTGLLDVAAPRLTLRSSEDTPLIHVESATSSRVNAAYKALFDRSVAFLLIIALAPLLLLISLSIKLSSTGPVLFRQNRIGARGVPFRIVKFRTMVPDAERHLEALRTYSDGNAVQFKMKRDPRVTPVGRVLRRYSLDELPQLFNVLFGTMSLVGPRPQSQQEVDQYDLDALRRLHVRPGMTGLWQISGRSDLDWEQSIRLDLRYVDNWSPIVDLQILLRTMHVVVRGAGAY